MGMDNTFFKIKKQDLKDRTQVHEIIYKNNKHEEYELVYFRKNYELQETIEKILKKDYIEHEIINKEELRETIKELENTLEDFYEKEKETKNDIIQRLFVDETIKVLNTIYKLFDFENYYLIYECIY